MIKFNTGRMYTDKGQRIAAQVLECDGHEFAPLSKVLFVDVDRGIAAIVNVLGDVNERSIMRAYDDSNLNYASNTKFGSLIKDLESAAATL